LPSGWPRPVPARLVFLSGAYQRITDAIDSHVQPGCDPGDDDNNGQVGARVLPQINLIAGQLCTDAGNGLDDEGQARDCRPELGFSVGVV